MQFDQLNTDNQYSIIENIIKRIDYETLKSAALKLNIDLPATCDENELSNINFRQLIYNTLFTIDITEGLLTCSKCNNVFKIKDGKTEFRFNFFLIGTK